MGCRSLTARLLGAAAVPGFDRSASSRSEADTPIGSSARTRCERRIVGEFEIERAPRGDWGQDVFRLGLGPLPVTCSVCPANERKRAAVDSVEVQLKVLMLAGLGGDAQAHELLLRAVAVRLRFYFARRIGRDSPDVEDLVQETLIAIHRRRESFDPALPFTSWMHAIARYKLIDHYRRIGRRGHLPLDEIDEPAASDVIGPALAAADVDKLLAGLSEKHQAAIRLTRLEGFSVDEASRMTGQSPSAIKIGVHRGLKRLAERVRGVDDFNR